MCYNITSENQPAECGHAATCNEIEGLIVESIGWKSSDLWTAGIPIRSYLLINNYSLFNIHIADFWLGLQTLKKIPQFTTLHVNMSNWNDYNSSRKEKQSIVQVASGSLSGRSYKHRLKRSRHFTKSRPLFVGKRKNKAGADYSFTESRFIRNAFCECISISLSYQLEIIQRKCVKLPPEFKRDYQFWGLMPAECSTE